MRKRDRRRWRIDWHGGELRTPTTRQRQLGRRHVTGASAARTNANDSVSAAGWAGSITGTLARANSNDTAAAHGVATGSLQATSELLVRRPKKVYIRRRGNLCCSTQQSRLMRT